MEFLPITYSLQTKILDLENYIETLEKSFRLLWKKHSADWKNIDQMPQCPIRTQIEEDLIDKNDLYGEKYPQEFYRSTFILAYQEIEAEIEYICNQLAKERSI